MEEKKELRKVRLSRCYRWFLFVIMISIEGIMNVTNGLLSSATKEIKRDLNINDSKFGSFGTANSFGRIISSLIFSVINQRVSRKWTTIIGLGFHALFVFSFHLTNNVNILIFARGLQGFTQMLPSIYVPVWIDQFGIRAYKTVQITSVQLSQTSGKCIGYFLNMFFGLDNWKHGFLVEGIYELFCTVCCLISSEDYFSRTLFRPELSEEDEKKKRISCTIYEEIETKNKKEENKGNFFSDLKILATHSLFLLCMLSRIILHGLNTCLHFWLSDFLRNVILEKNQLKITICYSIICFAGPAGGIITNAILKPVIGNYETRKSSWPLVVLQTIASCLGISIGFMKSTISVTIATILFLIFNSSALPLLQGILISGIDKNLKVTGFGIVNILTQLLTSGTTPLLYGIINDRYKDRYPRLAMVCIMSLEFVAVPFLILLAILRNRKFDKEEELKNKEQETELIEK